jgi:hypothetical protein
MSGNDGINEPSSPACSANEADAAYMGYASRDEIVAFLNLLLEAERAGARVTLKTAVEAMEPQVRELAGLIHRDEAHWCAVLFDALARLEAKPSHRVGEFYDKAMAITDVPLRLSFLNKGQGWVVKKLREMLPKVRDEELYRDLDTMLQSHVRNIDRVEHSGLAKSP